MGEGKGRREQQRERCMERETDKGRPKRRQKPQAKRRWMKGQYRETHIERNRGGP